MYSPYSPSSFQSPTIRPLDEDYKKLVEIKSNIEKFIDPYKPSENIKRTAKNLNHSPYRYSGQKENLDKDNHSLLFQQIEKLTQEKENTISDLKKICEALVLEKQRSEFFKEKMNEYEKLIHNRQLKEEKVQGVNEEGTTKGLQKIIYQKDLEISDKTLELEEYKKFCRKLEEENKNFIEKFKALKSNQEEKNVDRNELTDNYEQRLTLLIKENERISMAYGQKNEEIDSLNLKMKIIERERNEEIEDLQKQLKKSRFSNREEDELLLENRIYKEKLLEFEGSIKFLKEEIERLSEIINKQQEECEFWKGKAQTKPNIFKNSIYNSNDSVGTKASNSVNLVETPNKLIENYRNLKNELEELKAKSQMYEVLLREKHSTIEILSAELQKNNEVFTESVKRKGFEFTSSPIKSHFYNYQ